MSFLSCRQIPFLRRHRQSSRRKSFDTHDEKFSNSSTTVSESEIVHKFLMLKDEVQIPSSQKQLQIHTVGKQYELVDHATIPEIRKDEVLIKVMTVGLNPIDWKAPAFGWGLPSLPCVLGRDFIGVVVKPPSLPQTPRRQPLNVGDIVAAVSTDYRDYRKAAFQQFAVAASSNIFRLPLQAELRQDEFATIGVAFVTAALSLGVCLGAKLTAVDDSNHTIDLLSIVHSTPSTSLPEDVRDECFSIPESERLKPDNWLTIWGAGTTVGFFLVQLAKLAGIKVIAVADAINSGSTLVDTGADVIVHRRDADEATQIVSGIAQGRNVHHAIDVVGKDTATQLSSTLTQSSTTQSHLVGIVGLPKSSPSHIKHHKVPVKLFHEIPRLGEALMEFLELLLTSQMLILPTVHVHENRGLEHVNAALDKLRTGGFNAQRIAVQI